LAGAGGDEKLGPLGIAVAGETNLWQGRKKGNHLSTGRGYLRENSAALDHFGEENARAISRERVVYRAPLDGQPSTGRRWLFERSPGPSETEKEV